MCPICNGTGKAVSKRRYNGVVDPQKPSIEMTCWMCSGNGTVIKQETKHALIHKYWTAGGKDAIKEG